MKRRKIWIGRWLMFVALAHTVVGVLVGAKVLADIAQRGVFNTVGDDAWTNAIVWFLLFGAPLALLGMAINTMEKNDRFEGARALGIGTGLLTLTGVVLMPVSGFWLAAPAAVALMRRG